MRRLLFSAAGILSVVLLVWWAGCRRSVYVATEMLPHPPEGSENARLLRERPHASKGEAAVLLLRYGHQALAAAQAFETAGVPFCVTKSLPEALEHPLVLIPSDDRPIRPSEHERAALRAFAEGGGTLVLQLPPDRLTVLTGVSAAKPRRSRHRLLFRTGTDEGFRYLDQPEEKEILLASYKVRQGPWTHGLRLAPGTEPVALFPDEEETAVSRKRIGAGRVYTLGFDLKDVLLRPLARRHFDAARAALPNGFEPAADVFPLILRAWYEKSRRPWARLRALPGTARGLLLLSHHIGWGATLNAAKAFALIERPRGVQATWFVETKYDKDFLSAPMLGPALIKTLRELAADGHELASHTVSHGPDLATLPFGTGRETKETYRPLLNRRGRTIGGSLMGELTVSRSLLSGSTGTIEGFRSAFLSAADDLDEGLRRAGYRYDSSCTAGSALTHFPFRMPLRRVMDLRSDILELPMSWQDENRPEDPVDPEAVLQAFAKVSANEAPFVWLIHPAGTPQKRTALTHVLDLRPKDTLVWPLGRAARFWRARSEARFALEPDGVLRVEAPEGEHALSFELSDEILSCAADPGFKVQCSGRLVVVWDTKGRPVRVRLTWKQRSGG